MDPNLNIVDIAKEKRVRVPKPVNAGADVASPASIKLQHVERNCFANCVANQSSMELLAGEPLRIVAGSLGFANPDPVWYEWGSSRDSGRPCVAIEEFLKCPVTGKGNAHFWLSTSDGRIYDIVDSYMRMVARTHGKGLRNSGLVAGKLVAGKTADAIRADHGLVYVEAPTDVTEALCKKFEEGLSVREIS